MRAARRRADWLAVDCSVALTNQLKPRTVVARCFFILVLEYLCLRLIPNIIIFRKKKVWLFDKHDNKDDFQVTFCKKDMYFLKHFQLEFLKHIYRKPIYQIPLFTLSHHIQRFMGIFLKLPYKILNEEFRYYP